MIDNLHKNKGIEKNGLTMQTKQELKLKSIMSQLAYIKTLKKE